MTLSSRFLAPSASEQPAPVPEPCLGVWRRILLESASGRDDNSLVWWLQTPRWHADLRLPAGRPDFSGIGGLAECDATQLAWLASQQGFCGVTQKDAERCIWHRLMDFQPVSGSRDIGHMVLEDERMIETGIDTDYREVWQRLPSSRGGTAVLQLLGEHGALPSRPTWLLVAGACFFYVRGRARPLPGATDLSSLIARCRPARSQLIEWLDFEISFGRRDGPTPWRIEHSTLPFREGQILTRPGAIQRCGHQIAVEGKHERRWGILDWSLQATL